MLGNFVKYLFVIESILPLSLINTNIFNLFLLLGKFNLKFIVRVSVKENLMVKGSQLSEKRVKFPNRIGSAKRTVA